jgi:hypothetical protein
MRRLLLVLVLLCGAVLLLPPDPLAPVHNPDGSYTMTFRMERPTRSFSLKATDVTYYPPDSADDGYVQGCDETYPPSGEAYDTATNVSDLWKLEKSINWGNSLRCSPAEDATVYLVKNLLIRFDTSALPDSAVISAASLRLRVQGKVDEDSRNVNCEYYSSTNWPIGTDDYAVTVGTSAFTASIASMSDYANNTFTLGSPTSVSLTGYTGFRFGVSGDAPAGSNTPSFMTMDAAGTNEDPLLSVTYTLGTTTVRKAIVIQ